MRITQVLQGKRSDVIAVAPSATILDAIAVMKQQQVGALVVLGDDRQLLGILSERDVIHGLASQGAGALHLAVGTIMRTDGPKVKLHDTVQSAMQMMTNRRVRHLPVVDGGRIMGIVSIGDLVKSRLDEKTQEASVLQDIATIRVLAD
jgi:CBS domain-containing protein